MRTSNQQERLAKLDHGEGTFVYVGGAFDTEAVPGVPAMGKDGHQLRSIVTVTMEDSSGNKVQVIDPKSSEKGALVWKKAPKFERKPLETFKMRIPGVYAEHKEGEGLVAKQVIGMDGKEYVPALYLEFPKGKPVFVGDPKMALKLRCFPFFKEEKGAARPEAKADAKGKAKGEVAEGK